jgi:hypothetical protein
MKRLLLLLLLLALAAGGYYYYRSLKQGPEYALLQAAAATQTHDIATFEKFVDVNSVTGHLVDQITNQSSLLGALNPGGLMFKGALRLLKPQLTKAAHNEVQRFVETGSIEGAAEAAPKGLGRVSLAGLASKVVSPETTFKGVKYTRQEGEQAFVGLEFTQPKYDTTMVMEVKLLHRGDHWQMTEITNTGDLLQGVARLEKKRLLGGK